MSRFSLDRLRHSTAARWRTAGAIILVVAAFGAAVRAVRPRAPEPTVLSYSALQRALAARTVDSLVVRPGQRIDGHWSPAAAPSAGPRFTVVYPAIPGEELLTRASEAGATVRFEAAGDGLPVRDTAPLLFSIVVIGIVAFVAFMQLRNQSGTVDATRRTGETRQTTFDDVAGNVGAVEELREIVDFLKSPARFSAVGAKIPKGALLAGPPGTGKTLLARAVAGEAGVPFFAISGSQITGFIVGLGAHRIRTLFKQARKRGGVIFIDEIDVLGGTRGRARGHGEDDRTLNQLLVEMAGFSPAAGVVVIAATNRPEDLDPALTRPGRFDRQIVVGLPSTDDRASTLRLHIATRRVPLAADVDLARLASLMPQSSGADLANLVNEAAISAARAGAAEVKWAHFEIARDRVLLGKERTGFRATTTEWNTVAYHEAGHAILGILCCPEDGLHKVTIQPRGQAMGVAHFAPDGDRHLYSRRYLEGTILKALGGRAAERVIFGEDAITSGASSDLMHATHVAQNMVYRLGMGSTTGLMVFSGAPGAVSGEIHAAMDREIIAMMDRLYARACELLAAHRPALEALAAALLERETLDGADAMQLLARHGVTPARAA